MQRKTLLTLTLFIPFIFSFKNSFAQYPGMRAVRAQMNQQFLNQQNRMQMQGRIWYMGGEELPEFNFQITMRDSTKKQIISAIYMDTITKKNYLVMVDKRYQKNDTNRIKKIFPSQTLYVAETEAKEGSGGDENAAVKYFFGRPADSCWMFKVKDGAISLFSNICVPWDDNFSPATVVGIQLNDDPIIKFSVDNLKKIIAGDAEAMAYFEKKKYFKAVDRYNKDAEKAGKN